MGTAETYPIVLRACQNGTDNSHKNKHDWVYRTSSFFLLDNTGIDIIILSKARRPIGAGPPVPGMHLNSNYTDS